MPRADRLRERLRRVSLMRIAAAANVDIEVLRIFVDDARVHLPAEQIARLTDVAWSPDCDLDASERDEGRTKTQAGSGGIWRIPVKTRHGRNPGAAASLSPPRRAFFRHC